jgi:hypothetical protein
MSYTELALVLFLPLRPSEFGVGPREASGVS